MRAQAAIEFLTTYSFLFLILAIVVVLMVFIAAAPSKTLPLQCVSYTGLLCNFVQIFSNSTSSYSLVTLSLTNSQSAPINITGMNATIRNQNYAGYCTPSFLYPGMGATCVANVTGALGATTLLQGYYSINANFCNSGVSNLSRAKCNYERVIYGGSFVATPVKTKAIVFSVVASRSPSTLQLLPFNVLSGNVVQPNNYTIVQNGVVVTNFTNGNTVYAYSSNGPALGVKYFGYKTSLFPATLTLLNNPNIACGTPYNSLLSIASTTLYETATTNVVISMEAGIAMEVFYKSAYPGNSFQSVFGGSGWVNSLPLGPTAYGPNTITLGKGPYNFEAMWSGTCGSAGVQVLAATSSAPATSTTTILTTTTI